MFLKLNYYMIGDIDMKNAKMIGIAIVTVVIAGIAVFVAIKLWPGNKPDDIDVGQVAVEEVEQTPVLSETATPESATSDLETNADGYGEETLTQTEDGSYLDGETTDEEDGLTDEETSEKPEATATPQPVQATPQPTAVPQPAATTVPQPEQVTQSEQSQDAGAVPDWFDSSDTGVTGEEYEQGLAELDGLDWE